MHNKNLMHIKPRILHEKTYLVLFICKVIKSKIKSLKLWVHFVWVHISTRMAYRRAILQKEAKTSAKQKRLVLRFSTTYIILGLNRQKCQCESTFKTEIVITQVSKRVTTVYRDVDYEPSLFLIRAYYLRDHICKYSRSLDLPYSVH